MSALLLAVLLRPKEIPSEYLLAPATISGFKVGRKGVDVDAVGWILRKYAEFAEIGRLGWQESPRSAKARVLRLRRRGREEEDWATVVDYRDIVRLTLERYGAVLRAGIGPALVAHRDRRSFFDDGGPKTPLPPLEDFARILQLEQHLEFTQDECIASAQTCGSSCGQLTDLSRAACWCVRLAYDSDTEGWSVSYQPKWNTENPEENFMSWRSPSFSTLQSYLNVLQIALDRMEHLGMSLPTHLVYLVLNLESVPRNFLPYFDPPSSLQQRPVLPQVTPLGYPPSDATIGRSPSLFPLLFEWEEGLGVHYNLLPCINNGHECCNVGRGQWHFQEELPVADYHNLDHIPFPIMSHSVTPQYSFDLLIPSRHHTNSHGRMLDAFRRRPPDVTAGAVAVEEAEKTEEVWTQQPPYFTRIPHVAWKDKRRTIAFAADFLKCRHDSHSIASHKTRFCVQLNRDYEATYRDLWNMEGSIEIGGVQHLEEVPRTNRLSLRQLAECKFVVLVDGMREKHKAETSNTWMYTLGSVVLSSGFHLDVRLALLKPYVHYIPFVLDDPASFWAALELVATDDDYAQWVASNLRHAAFTIFSGSPINLLYDLVPTGKHERSDGEDNEREESPVEATSEKLNEGATTDGQDDDTVAGFTFDGGHHFDVVYWMELLQQYTRRFRFQDIDNDDNNARANFTSDRSCDTLEPAKEHSRANENRREMHLNSWSDDYACDQQFDPEKQSIDPITQKPNTRFVQHYLHPWLTANYGRSNPLNG